MGLFEAQLYLFIILFLPDNLKPKSFDGFTDFHERFRVNMEVFGENDQICKDSDDIFTVEGWVRVRGKEIA